MVTQAVSEEAHCWAVRDRWKQYVVDEAPADAIAVVPVTPVSANQVCLKPLFVVLSDSVDE